MDGILQAICIRVVESAPHQERVQSVASGVNGREISCCVIIDLFSAILVCFRTAKS